MYRILSIRRKSQRSQRLMLALAEEGATEPAEAATVLELAAEVYAGAGLGVGDRLAPARVEALRSEDEGHRCRERAWSLLARRPRSRAELRSALRQRRFSAAAIEATLGSLEARGHLDDAEFARLAVEQAVSSRRAGPRLVRRLLGAKGVSPAIADAALAPVADPAHQREAARALLLKWNRRTNPVDPVRRHAAAGAFLLRRGFDPGLVRAALREVLGQVDAGPADDE